MASNVRIKWNHDGFYKLRTGPGALAEVDSRAKRVKAAATAQGGGKYEVRTVVGERNPQGRARSSVTTADFRARRKNARHHTLLKALDAAR